MPVSATFTSEGLQISYVGGVAAINYRDLTPDLQQTFRYDANKGRRNPNIAGQEAFQALKRLAAETQQAEANERLFQKRAHAAPITDERTEARRIADEQANLEAQAKQKK